MSDENKHSLEKIEKTQKNLILLETKDLQNNKIKWFPSEKDSEDILWSPA